MPIVGDIYLVRSNSLLSRIIRYWTRSKFSHGGIVFADDYKGIEANHKGVEIVDLPKENVIYLSPSVPFTDSERLLLETFLIQQLGKKYDFMSIVNFIFQGKNNNTEKWYCFELIYEAYNAAGKELCRLDEYFIDGHILFSSLLLKPTN